MASKEDNLQQQADEISLLECIFADEVQVLDPTHLVLNVPVTLPRETITLKLPPVHEADKGEDVQITALPPVMLSATFHAEYPSSCPPYYSISCNWLNTEQLKIVGHMLDKLWSDSFGEVVLFRWASWVRDELWAYFKFGDTFTPQFEQMDMNTHTSSSVHLDHSHSSETPAQQSSLPHPESPSALSPRDESTPQFWSQCTPFIIPYLLAFNTEHTYRIFTQGTQTCDICYGDAPGDTFIMLDCGHYHFCSDCVGSVCNINIDSGTFDKIVCPDRKCNQQILPHIVQRLVPPDKFEKYERLLLERGLAAMSDVEWCPHCEAPVIAETDDSHLGACPNCSYSFCTLCKTAWHPGQPCANDAQRIAELERRMVSAKPNAKQAMQMEINNIEWIMKNCKPCPNCKAVIQKTEGCNKMTCFSCHKYFCWLCNKVILGYDHFGSRCVLFDNVLPGEHGGQLFGRNAAQVFNRMRVMNGIPAMIKLCPQCKQQNMKAGQNNHVFCWNCTSQWCFLCRTIIKGTAHFMKTDCKQHTL